MKYFIRYGEIGVKSPKIRRKFENRLMSNIKCGLNCTFENDQGRITLITDENNERVNDVLGRVFGIVSYSPVIETRTDNEDIAQLIEEHLPEIVESGKFNPNRDTFAVRCRRVGKHEFTSQEMAAYVGSVVIGLTSAKVNLSEPDFTVYVEVRDDKTYLYFEKIKCLGGLPVGSQGRVVCLISSGIDSPVAAFQMLKRGCSVTLLHCDNHPYTSGSIEKVLQNADNIRKYSLGEEVPVYSVKFGQYLEHAQREAPPRMTCVLCKSGMYQIASILAKREKANAIVDGSSIGQVASQTLNNIEATRYHCRMPIFSPLICWDKLEIEELGKKIGTYEVSIIPDSGCSAVPKYPETHADLELFKKTVEKIKQKEVLEECAESFTRIDL
ncbi:MAG: tRNA 4-thiouridine(8) synthase ThiI [Methanosphaera sp. rholeuAM270]|nr:MAG: tRNA 4-thiouridine(8) synthase ThiI [Methanosphaera sp. rholeuAM270]